MLIERKEYVQQLAMWRDEEVIKVITGIRRCGKSVLLKLYVQYLQTQGVTAEQIHFINFEDLEHEELLDYKKLYVYIKESLCPQKQNYVLLDEIQLVPDFQKVVDSLQLYKNIDIYITGSNAYLLSGELATLLSGRYVEIKLLPLSFREFATAYEGRDRKKLFNDYLQTGGFPYLTEMRYSADKAAVYLEGIYNTIVVKDIAERDRCRNGLSTRRIGDTVLLQNIAKFLAGSIGSPISVRSITNYLISSGRKVSLNTVGDYLRALVEPFIFYPAERFDVAGKELMKTNGKYYIADLALRRYLLPRRDYDMGFALENLVYLELLRRGYRVNVGKIGNREIDFVITKDGKYEYVQVCASLLDKSTFDREIEPLYMVRDNYRKFILTLDEYTLGNYDGIEVLNVVEWLLGEG